MLDRTITPGPMVAAALLLAAAAIGGAWWSQLALHYVPCKLCLEQRVPYYVGIPLLALAALSLAAGWSLRFTRLLLAAAGLVFLVGVALGVRHAGVEWGFWEGPGDCGGGFAPTTDAGDLLGQLATTRVVSCTEAAGRFLGLSFAGWNAVVSLLVATLAFAAAGRRQGYQ